ALPQQAATRSPIERHTPKMAAIYVRDPVMPRQPLVDERVVGAQEIDNTAVLADDAPGEELGFPVERLAQVVVEVRKRLGIRRHVPHVPQEEPLPGEVVHERAGAVVGEEPAHLLLQHLRMPQLASDRDVEQFVVRNAAPDEEGQARGQLDVAEPIRDGGRGLWRILFDSEQEVDRDQNPSKRRLDAALEAALSPSRVIEREKRLNLVVAQRPAVCTASEPLENARRAGLLFGRPLRRAHENPAPAWRVAGTSRRMRTSSVDVVDGRIGVLEAGVLE